MQARVARRIQMRSDNLDRTASNLSGSILTNNGACTADNDRYPRILSVATRACYVTAGRIKG